MEDSKKRIYDSCIERLESSLITRDGAKEAIDELRVLGEYEDAAKRADEYERLLKIRMEDEDGRARRRRAGRAVQYILIGVLALVVIAIIALTVLAVTEAF